MARRRNRGVSSGYFGRTKGHSILPQRSYGLSSRSSRYYSDEDYPSTYIRPSSQFHPGADYFMAESMSNHAAAVTTDTVYDNIDLAAKSRGKDKRLMSQVNAALAYATPTTPARARASRRANRERAPVQATSAYQTYSTAPCSVPYQVPIIPLSPPLESRIENNPVYRYRSVSPAPGYMYWRPVGGRARARTSRRDLAKEYVPLEMDRRSRSVSPVRGLSYYNSPPRQAELDLSPTRLERSPSRAIDGPDYPHTREWYSWYPRGFGNRARHLGFPIGRSRWARYPYAGTRWSGYPFGPTRWIVPPSTASRLGVHPVRAGRCEDVEPLPFFRKAMSPDLISPWDISSARWDKWGLLGAYDPHWDITPAEATRFGIEPTFAAKWNAASPIRTGRWDPIPSETRAWDTPIDDTFMKRLHSLRAASPMRATSPARGNIRSLDQSEAVRWGIRPDEAVEWGFYPASRTVSPFRSERARSLSPFRCDWGQSPAEDARWGLAPRFRSRSLSPSAGRNWFVSPLEEARWSPYPMKPRDLSPLRFVPLPLRSYARTYVPPRMGKKAIAPSKASRRAAARRMGYYPRPPMYPYLPHGGSTYFEQKYAGKRARSPIVSERETRSRPRPGHVARVIEMFRPRKPYEAEYSGKMATARALARAMRALPEDRPQYIVYPDEKAAIISPMVEIETKKKKVPTATLR